MRQPIPALEKWAAVAIVVGLCLAVYYRLFFGVSIADEAFYTTTALLPAMGGKWYVTELLFQQTGNMLYAPILFLYRALFGTTGIILFVRHLEFLLSLVVAYNVFLLLKEFNRWSVALLLSSICVTFVPSSIQSLSYNTLGSLLFGLAAALSVRAYLHSRKKLAFISGVIWVLHGFSYPTLTVCFLTFFPAAWWFSRKDKQRLRNFLWPLILGVVLTALPLLGFLLSLGLDNIINSVRFTAGFASPGGLWKLTFSYLLLLRYLPPPYLVAAVLLAWAYFGRKNLAASVYIFAAFIAVFFLFGGHYETISSQVLWGVLQFLLVIYLFIRRGQIGEPEKILIWFVIVPAMVGSFAGCLTSRATLYIMALTGLYGGLILTSMIARAQLAAGWIVALLLSGFACAQLYEQVYEDDALVELDYTIPSGPLKGIATFQEKAHFIEGIQDDLKEYHISGKKIVFKDFFPIGYLMADNIPSPPSLYMALAHFYLDLRHLYVEAFSQPGMLPEVVVELRYYPVRVGEKWNYFDPRVPDPFKDFFMQTGAYTVLVERPTHRILVRKY